MSFIIERERVSVTPSKRVFSGWSHFDHHPFWTDYRSEYAIFSQEEAEDCLIQLTRFYVERSLPLTRTNIEVVSVGWSVIVSSQDKKSKTRYVTITSIKKLEEEH